MKTGIQYTILLILLISGQPELCAQSSADTLLPIDTPNIEQPTNVLLEELDSADSSLLSLDSNVTDSIQETLVTEPNPTVNVDKPINIKENPVEKPITELNKNVPLPDACSMQFIKYKTEHDPSSIYFNVLKITNNSDKPVVGELKISVPDGWNRVLNVFGDELVRLEPGESVNLPLRVSMPKLVVGGIAYVISAELMDAEDIPLIPSTYSYVYIPRVSDWKMSSDNRYVYVNDGQTLETLNVKLSNRGNAEENLKIVIELGSRVKINGSDSKHIEMGLTLKPYSDTTLRFQAEYIASVDYFPSLTDNKMVVTARGEDDVNPKNLNFWFEQVNSVYKNELIDDDAPLIAWLDLFNLVTAEGSLLLQGGVKGTVLLNDKRKVQYYWNNPNLLNKNTGRTAGVHYYNFSRFFVRYNTPKYTASAGDISMSGWMMPLNGRGIGGSYKEKKYNVYGAATKNIFNPVYQVGARGSYKISKTLIGHGGLTFRRDNTRSLTTIAPAFGGTTRIGKQSLMGIISVPIVSLNGTTKVAYGHQLSYSSTQIKNLQLNAYNRYTSDWYIDLGGNFMSNNLTANYKLEKLKSTINYVYTGVISNPTVITSNFQKQNVGRRNFHINSLLYSKSFKNGSNISTGPGYQYYGYDFSFTTQPEFISHNYTYMVMASKRKNRYRSTSGTVQMGYTNIDQYDLTTAAATTLDPYLNTSLIVNSRFKRNGFIFGYYYGSPSYTSQRYLTEGGKGTKSIRVNPYFNFTMFDKKLDVQSNISLWYFINNRITRMSIFNYLDYDLGKGWSATGNILFYYFKRNDIEASSQAYLDFNMNVGIRKVFDFDQPRQTYQNLEVIFFKDLNGNKIKDENEVGIPNIMMIIENKKDSLNVAASEYFVMNLMTNQFGQVNCERIPSGVYTVTTQQEDGSVGEYINQLGAQFELIVDGDVVQYVPFVKSNKIYGSVVIKRDPFSALGYVSPANIRVSAIDSVGNTYSALTDKEGDFVLFAPQAGLYKIRVRNIFGNNFKLRQEEFVVDFNGLKEFRVTFLFNENKRKINFKGDINGFNFAENNFSVNDTNRSITSEQEGSQVPTNPETDSETDSAEENSPISTNGENGNSEQEEGDPHYEEISFFDHPIDKEKVFYKVQLGAYSDQSQEMIDKVKSALPEVHSYKTEHGLNRLIIGEFKNRQEAENLRQSFLRNEDIPNKQFIILVGEYFGRYFTADEADALLKDDE